MTQQNEPTCPRCYSDVKATQIGGVLFSTIDGRWLDCAHEWHLDRCPTCGSDNQQVKLCVTEKDAFIKHIPGNDGSCKECPNDWHREPAAPPSDILPGHKEWCLSKAFLRDGTRYNCNCGGVSSVYEVKPDAMPSCHVCGAEMVPKEWKCLSCGAMTGVVTAPPEGETMHFPIDKTDAYDERVDRTRAKASEAVASPAMPFPDELTTKQEQEILTPLPYLQAIWNTRDLTFERVVSVMEAYAAALTADKDKEIERLKEDLRVARQTVIAVLGCAEKAEARVTELEAELARLREQVRQTKGEREEGE